MTTPNIKHGLLALTLTFLSLSAHADPFQAAVIDRTAGASVNIRAGEGTSTPVIARVRTGEVFYAISSSDAWWRVTDQDGHEGYMLGTMIDLIPGPRPLHTPADMSATDMPTDPADQYALGLKFRYGTGVAMNQARAFYWFSQAAAQGHITARARVGEAYCSGRGAPKDFERGMKILRETAEAGDAIGQASCAAELFIRQVTHQGEHSVSDMRLTSECANLFTRACAHGGEDGARAVWLKRNIELSLDAALRQYFAEQFANAFVQGLMGGGNSSRMSEDERSRNAVLGMKAANNDAYYGGRPLPYSSAGR